mmetsp:Transcript_75959/g.183660  ORF Transcript_75959/g.183660 Transcript_75959/m.183660 type:complete len:504 (-) Transcript_75959:911-2422(-)
MVRHERHELLLHADRPHPRPAAAVRDAKRLVQVKVADVGADEPRRGEPDLRVHVRAVHVHLAAALVHDGHHLLDLRVEDAERGRVRDHQRRQLVRVLVRLGAQVVHVDQPVVRALHYHHVHAGHGGRRRVGAVRADGDEALVAVALPRRAQVLADGQQPRVLARRAAVGLRRHRREARDLAQRLVQRADQRAVTGRLVQRRERVHVGELGPRDGHHLGRRVKLHSARTQRDHAGGEGQVARLHAVQVAQHLRLAAVVVEHLLLQERRGARVRRVDGLARRRRHVALHVSSVVRDAKHAQDVRDVLQRGRLVQCHAHGRVGHAAQVHAGLHAASQHRVRVVHGHRDGVEARGVGHGHATGGQTRHQHALQAMHAPRDVTQPSRPVVNGVGGRDVGQQRLRRADVGRGLVAPDVLLTRLHGHAQRGLATRVARDADHTAGHLALEFVGTREESRVRATIAHGHAQALCRANGHVGAPLTRRAQQRQRQQIGGSHHHGAGGACGGR